MHIHILFLILFYPVYLYLYLSQIFHLQFLQFFPAFLHASSRICCFIISCASSKSFKNLLHSDFVYEPAPIATDSSVSPLRIFSFSFSFLSLKISRNSEFVCFFFVFCEFCVSCDVFVPTAPTCAIFFFLLCFFFCCRQFFILL